MERFSDFVKVVVTLSQEDYLEQFPHPLLLYCEQARGLDQFRHTQLVDSGSATEAIDRFNEDLLDFLPLLPNPRTGREFPEKAFIGRDDRRDFVIPHSTVSSRHACLFRDPESRTWKLVDSGSTNGTQVRGRPLNPGDPAPLHDGDVLSFGKVDFLFFAPDSAYRYMRQFRMFRDAMKT